MNLEIRPVETAIDKKKFYELPYFIYKDDPNWVPQIIQDVKHVFDEIELQYDIRIVKKNIAKIPYTGNFKKSTSVDEVLNLVCIPLGLEFSKVSSKKYIVVSKQAK